MTTEVTVKAVVPTIVTYTDVNTNGDETESQTQMHAGETSTFHATSNRYITVEEGTISEESSDADAGDQGDTNEAGE